MLCHTGFLLGESRDIFLTLWLERPAEGCTVPAHFLSLDFRPGLYQERAIQEVLYKVVEVISNADKRRHSTYIFLFASP